MRPFGVDIAGEEQGVGRGGAEGVDKRAAFCGVTIPLVPIDGNPCDLTWLTVR